MNSIASENFSRSSASSSSTWAWMVTSSAVVGSSAIKQRWPIHHGHGDHDPLALTAGELVGIAASAPVGVVDSHRAQGFHSAAPGVGLADMTAAVPGMCQDGLGNLVADPHHRIERGHGLLEDHADTGAADMLHLRQGQAEEIVLISKPDASVDASLRRQQAQDSHAN